MSVDPDDNTPGAIARSGARIVTYGTAVLSLIHISEPT